jgi:hypothetical protein
MSKSPERRITIPEDIWRSLKYYAADEQLRVTPEIRGSITPENVAWEILKNHMQKMGHYPPKESEATP